jgi:hypothetical protein
MSNPDSINVFRDLVVHIPYEEREPALALLEAAAKEPWSFDSERTDRMRRSVVGDRQVLAFTRAPNADFPAATLSLWSHQEGLVVPNVVPLEIGELNYAQYNAILEDFTERVVRPVADRMGLQIALTEGRQKLTDWIPEEVAQKLLAFSTAANKSTGSSHPMDRQRWFDFILSVHRSGSQLGSDQLERWLNEIHRWDLESAYKLSIEFEQYIALLDYAATH